jgi:hypothetical protein
VSGGGAAPRCFVSGSALRGALGAQFQDETGYRSVELELDDGPSGTEKRVFDCATREASGLAPGFANSVVFVACDE